MHTYCNMVASLGANFALRLANHLIWPTLSSWQSTKLPISICCVRWSIHAWNPIWSICTTLDPRFINILLLFRTRPSCKVSSSTNLNILKPSWGMAFFMGSNNVSCTIIWSTLMVCNASPLHPTSLLHLHDALLVLPPKCSHILRADLHNWVH